MIILILCFFTALIVTYLGIPSIIIVANRKHLFDKPDERKIHDSDKPTLGGLGIFAGLIFAFTFWASWTGQLLDSSLSYILSAVFILFFIGIKDDLAPLTAIKKFIGQLVSASIVVFLANLNIDTLFGFFGIYQLPYFISVLLSIFTIVLVINAFNLIDGVDGLAGGLGLIAALNFGFIFFLAHDITYALLAFALGGALLGFLKFNFSPAQIFMGDTGSLILGLMLSVFSIRYLHLCADPASLLQVYHLNPAFCITLLIIPLFDTLRVFIIRIVNKRSPFSPDRNHIHHMIMNLNMSHSRVCFILYCAQLLFIIVGILTSGFHITLYLILMLFFALILSQFPQWLKKGKKINSYE